MKTPVRIYVLWHSEFEEGQRLARAVYHWFRLPSSEGIPVYFRRCDEAFTELHPDCELNIIIPLVDPNMVASVQWRQWMSDLAEHCVKKNSAIKGRLKKRLNKLIPDSSKCALFPIALHDTAYQMPTEVRKLNFIRPQDNQETDLVESLLIKLTEALCLILRKQVVGKMELQPIKIFLSHAKADGTDVPKEIKNFIQTETQCQAFFDENDIAYGHDFKDTIEQALMAESAGLLVIQGDHYADRPWCRKEIRDFLTPLHVNKKEASEHPVFSVMPAVAVTNFVGNKVARTIPELGYTSCIQWQKGAARTAVVAMLREILLSSFYRLLAKSRAGVKDEDEGSINILVNQPPDPLMIAHMLRIHNIRTGTERKVKIMHPGHGLSGVEHDGLTRIYDRDEIEFISFADVGEDSGRMNVARDLTCVVIGIFIGNATDILDAGYGEDHANELLRRILLPLFRRGVSLLYGGALPKWDSSKPAWEQHVNFTEIFLEMLLAERERNNNSDEPDESEKVGQRLYNLSSWPQSCNFTVEQQAQWINTCTFIRIPIGDASGRPTSDLPENSENDHLTKLELRDRIIWRNAVFCLSKMRKASTCQLQCDVPGRRGHSFQAMAHIMLGGKLEGYSGIIPGVWEEILYSMQRHQPFFIISAIKGAAGKFAEILLTLTADKLRSKVPIDALTINELFSDPDERIAKLDLSQSLNELPGGLGTEQALMAIWDCLRITDESELGVRCLCGLLRNGLDYKDNKTLMTSDSFSKISELIKKGIECIQEDKIAENIGKEGCECEWCAAAK